MLRLAALTVALLLALGAGSAAAEAKKQAEEDEDEDTECTLSQGGSNSLFGSFAPTSLALRPPAFSTSEAEGCTVGTGGAVVCTQASAKTA